MRGQGEGLKGFVVHQDGERSELLACFDGGLQGVREGDGGGEFSGVCFGQEELGGFGEDGLDALGHAQGHGDGGEGFGGGGGHQAVPGEAVVEQGFGGLEAVGGGGGAEDHGDQLHAVLLCRGGDAVESAVRRAGLEARGPVVKADELVGVGQLEAPVPQGIHPDGGVGADVRVLQNQLTRHEGDVVGGGVVPLGGQAGAVAENGVFHAQLGGAGVHSLHKGGFAACQMLGHGHAGVVAGGHGDGLEHIVDGERFTFLHVDLGPAHPGGVGGDSHHRVGGQRSVLQGLHDEQHGHDFRHAGQLQRLFAVFFIQNFSRGFFHQQHRLGLDLRPRRPRSGGKEAHAQGQAEGEGTEFFHSRTSQ